MNSNVAVYACCTNITVYIYIYIYTCVYIYIYTCFLTHLCQLEYGQICIVCQSGLKKKLFAALKMNFNLEKTMYISLIYRNDFASCKYCKAYFYDSYVLFYYYCVLDSLFV